jgi:hypothetical protein
MAQHQQTVQVTQSAEVPQVVVDLVRVVDHRYTLYMQGNQVARKAKDVRAPILAKAKDARESLTTLQEQWGALTPESPAQSFKDLAISMAKERSEIKTVQTQAKNATSAQTETLKSIRASMKADDTNIVSYLSDSFIRSLISPQ